MKMFKQNVYDIGKVLLQVKIMDFDCNYYDNLFIDTTG